MTLRKKIIIFFTAALLLSLLFLYLAANYLLLGNFSRLEEENLKEDMQRVLLSLSDSKDQLTYKTQDYAVWDDTYRYANNPNPLYENANFSKETFGINRFNAIILLNKNRDILYQGGYNLQTKQIEKVSQSLVKMVQKDTVLVSSQTVTGIVNLPEGPMLVVAQPILQSDFSGPSAGTMITGRFLDKQVLSRLVEKTLLPAEFEDIQEVNIPAHILPKKPVSLETAPIWVETYDSSNQAAYTILTDIHGENNIALRLPNERSFFMQGKSSVVSLLLLLASAAVVLFNISLYFLDKSVFKRLRELAHTVTQIRHSNDLSSRITINRNDEISSLENEFNAFLTSLETSRQEIMTLAYEDTLTRLPNRAFFYKAMNEAFSPQHATKRLSAILFIDLDGFKQVNDTLGHDGGDLLLQHVAQQIKSCLRETDVVSRLGGDEFTIFLRDLKSETEAQDIAERIGQTLSQPFQIHEAHASVSASIGISLYPEHGDHPEILIKKADQAMFQAKQSGKNRVHLYKAV
ncbi:diguanylate cyclase (GGDEF)-like protein [Bacillus ectoiniformans]|uniref:sensor domain-containing diguanylate cyclase n=1 Tax=Bacillus ectoiniformans TaxID=1494429 RepID=UPI00195943A4|nr:diguanylate cyclase [Bacillus ectoiniformans]MBM7648273.1 diguanylate cyclase (GGDEF)-like protein [Bacillus ectoiniformans]